MKKTFLLIAVAFGIAQFAHAQRHAEGDKNLNIGLGLGSQFGGGIPIGASFELGIKENISVGGYAGYAGYKETLPFFGDVKYTYIILGGRGSYHFDLGPEALDPYAGVMLGYNVASVDINGVNAGGGLLLGGYLGARYAFSDKMGAFAELGYGIAWLQLGLNVKF